MRLEDIDICSPDTYVNGVPHEAYRLLRKEAPVHFFKETGSVWTEGVERGPGFWALTKYADMVAVSKDPTRFSSARGGTNIEEVSPEDLSVIRLLMVNMDPPEHGKFRRLVSMGFTPRMVALLEPRIRQVANQLLDGIAGKGEADFVQSIAVELPLQVICEFLGVPHEDRHKVIDWSNRLLGFDDPELNTSPADAKIAAMEMWMYASELTEVKKVTPGEDLISILLKAELEGLKLTEEELYSFFLLLSVAGNETTRNLVSGGLLALMEHPEQRALLVANPALIPSAAEEMLRWVCPLNYFRRTATVDLEIRGVKIREGDKVAMFYPSANRDEDVFPHADKFDILRTPNEHLSFGIGEHFCLGANLARLEIRVLFEELLRRLPDMALNGPVRKLRSNFINGYKSLPVRFTPEKA
jgi:cholest-4-en-3-one 26-monooxygenase